VLRRLLNRVLHLIARQGPGATTFRPWLHRLRGVSVGNNVFVGDEVYLESEYPESIEIRDGVQVSVRAIFIAHTRGPGKIVIGKNAYIGPNAVIACSGGRVVRIGEGAVIGAGTVITRDVPARAVIINEMPAVVAKASVSLCEAETFEQFLRGLVPVRGATNRHPHGNASKANRIPNTSHDSQS
jgi:serine acetyltransferase